MFLENKRNNNNNDNGNIVKCSNPHNLPVNFGQKLADWLMIHS